MQNELAFTTTLEELVRLSGEQGHMLKKSQVETAFAALELKPEQMGLIYDYLQKRRIGIDEAPDPEEYLSEEDHGYLKVYLRELEALYPESGIFAEYKEGSPDAEHEAGPMAEYKRKKLTEAMSGNAEAVSEAVCAYLPDVVEIAKLYAGQGVLLEDLIGEGNMALALAADMLAFGESADEAEGMVVRTIMDSMEKLVRDHFRESEAGEKLLDKVSLVAGKAEKLARALGRKVSADELAADTGIPREDILEAARVAAGQLEYLESGE